MPTEPSPASPSVQSSAPERAYPAHWEADVVLRDGGTARVRPITPDDAERLVSFYEKVSDESKYYRFFAPYPRLSDKDVHRFTHHDYVDRVGLAATVADDFIATVRYDRIDGSAGNTGNAGHTGHTAEVAFLVQDAHQGRGLASALLEHIAAVARERGITRFSAEVLPANRKMVKVFTDAGYTARRSFADGAVHLTLDLAPTEESLAVMRAREQRAEARSVQRLLAPASVAVVGASRRPGGAGRTVLESLRAAGFTGRLHAVNHALGADGGDIGGVPARRSLADLPEPPDLAVLAVPAAELPAVVADCGARGVQGLVVMTADVTPEEQRALVRLARSHGMRLIGPNALGVINTAPEVRLNATLSRQAPRTGRIGLFTQSGAIGIALLEALHGRGAGLSTVVSAGNRADVSGNDLLQYWDEDPATDVVVMYLESIGNPRKFTRLARRVSARTPLVVARGARHHDSAAPQAVLQHAADAPGTPDATVTALLRQAGVIAVDTVTEQTDAAVLLASQPLPAGDRVAVLGNAASLCLLSYDAARAEGLRPAPPRDLGTSATSADLARALSEALADDAERPDDNADAAVVTVIPRIGTTAVEELAGLLGEAVAAHGKPVVVVHLALEGLEQTLAAHGVPGYPAPERAVRALAHAARHAAWRRAAADPGDVPALDDVDEGAARALLTTAAPAGGGSTTLPPDETVALLAAYGIRVQPVRPAPDADAAARAAAELGYPVALKATAPRLRHRADLGGVRLDLPDETRLRASYAELTAALGPPAELLPVVQVMAPRGVDTVVRGALAPDVGAVLSFGLAGTPSELLGDTAHRLVPATDKDVAELVRGIRAAPILFGWRGAAPVDTVALEDLLLRVSRLLDDQTAVRSVDLEPVVVASRGLRVLGASVRVAAPAPRPDLGPRRLPAY